ncbi:MAG: metallophosphoesterase [Solirubrobacteraceae bacterium]
MSRYIEHQPDHDDVDRRGFLKCMAWAGTGVVFAVTGCGVTTERLGVRSAAKARATFTFVQISDSHIGFDKAANKDVVGTLEQCVARINALAQRPTFVIHTGDHVHLSTPEEFDAAKQILSTIDTDQVLHVPGEHDVFVDQGRRYRQFFGQGSQGSGYYSFDTGGVHFLALANVQASEAESQATTNGLGVLGAEQLAFIKRDLAAVSSDTPVVIFGHVPLLAVYPQWGWATADSVQVLAQLKRFGSVTALNGHIHQLISKTEANVVMHTAASTAYPLHPPGNVAPEPLVVPAGTLPSRIGIRTVHFVRGSSSIALIDQALAGSAIQPTAA